MITNEQYKALVDGWELRNSSDAIRIKLYKGEVVYADDDTFISSRLKNGFMWQVVPDENGYLPWFGGENPAPSKPVELHFRDGSIGTYDDSGQWTWAHGLKEECHNEIVKYRVCKPKRRLMTHDEIQAWLLHTPGAVWRIPNDAIWISYVNYTTIPTDAQRAIMDESGNVSQITDCYIEEDT